MSTNNTSKSDGCLGFFLGSLLCFGIIAQFDSMPWNVQSKHVPYEPPKEEVKHTSNIVDNGQRTRKIIKTIRVIPTTQTYEVSRWITSGDWSHDNDEMIVTIPNQTVIMDIDYVDDHWDDFISDPEDEIQFPHDMFQ